MARKFSIALIITCTLSFNSTPLSANTLCADGDYKLDIFDIFSGALSLTEISIEAEGRDVCTEGVASSISEGVPTEDGTAVVIAVENSRLRCFQLTTELRLHAVRELRRAMYFVRGEYIGTSSGGVDLRNCEFLSPY